MLGLRLKCESRPFVAHLRDNHQLLTVAAADQVVRPAAAADYRAGGDRRLHDQTVGRCGELRAGGGRRLMPHFLELHEVGADALGAMLDEAGRRKAARVGWTRGAGRRRRAAGRPHARLRVREGFDPHPACRSKWPCDSWAATPLVLDAASSQLGRGEPVEDTARVLGRMADAVMLRTDDPAKLARMAEHAGVPVVNGLSDASPPLSDGGRPAHRARAAGAAGWRALGVAGRRQQRAAFPGGGHRAHRRVADRLRAGGLRRRHRSIGDRPGLERDPRAAVEDAQVVVTDSWISMGQADADEKRRALAPYRVTEPLMAAAAPGALFLHCLPDPSRRGSGRRGDSTAHAPPCGTRRRIACTRRRRSCSGASVGWG